MVYLHVNDAKLSEEENQTRLDERLNKFIIPNIGLDMPIYTLAIDGASVGSLEQIEKRRINRLL